MESGLGTSISESRTNPLKCGSKQKPLNASTLCCNAFHLSHSSFPLGAMVSVQRERQALSVDCVWLDGSKSTCMIFSTKAWSCLRSEMIIRERFGIRSSDSSAPSGGWCSTDSWWSETQRPGRGAG
ncbi:hypothetical protein CONPUDRAFT_145898 [Coniophora puteana RWD-64-598 SS2]|uniref:Uncharacterized protein n=1 Tax=Coniophora puteana (strain RWD-64-598) TaxID=741705 RepID=A0A5M3MFB6_CONPW|nr:uncharacterized protein CONPUDRAFT_145898 [Coniophora puteana RWD-64-598 SS2]EIW77620.1 hypothetical protein CONPUDRAFT_145898 [Coniophora puteana RWD-64-598 SS2]